MLRFERIIKATNTPALRTSVRTFRPLISRQKAVPTNYTSISGLLRTKSKFPSQKRTFVSSFLDNSTTVISKGQRLFFRGVAAVSIAGLTLLAMQAINQQTLSSSYEQEIMRRIRTSYGHLSAGIASTAAMAYLFFHRGIPSVLSRVSPVALFFGCFLMTISTAIGTQIIDYQANPTLKYTIWTLFNASVAFSVCPMIALGSQVLLRAALATGAIIGSMSVAAAAAPDESMLQMGSFLGVGLGVLIAASIGQLFFPSRALNAITLYGGLGLFSLFAAYDTQRLLSNCRYSSAFDPINNSIGLYMDFINIFVRMVYIMSSGNKK